MNKQVIEHAGLPVGIVIPDGDRLKFIAVKFPVIDLDGEHYRNVDEARAAIRHHIESGYELRA